MFPYLLLSILLASIVCVNATLPKTIFYYVTVRSFIANPCRITNYTNFNAGISNRNNWCPNVTSIKNQVINGEISGHPDFQRLDGNFWSVIDYGTTMPYNGKFAKFGKSFPRALNTGNRHPYTLSGLKYETTGIPKMKYCRGEEGFVCDFNQTQRAVYSEDSFHWWHHDNPYYSLRSGCKQNLTLNPDKTYTLDGGDFYNPISEFKLNGWPLSLEEKNNYDSQKYWFTTEIHTSFQYNGTEIFEFKGDDDVHVYINERLAVDIGGVHDSTTVSITLNQYEKELNITKGGIYQFDLFHAERQTTDSNYLLTTALAQTCNVVTSNIRSAGRDVSSTIDWTAAGTTSNSDWLFVSGPGYGSFQTPTVKRAILMAPGPANVVSYLMHRQKVNVGSGFALNFDFNMTGNGHGFALVFHDRELGLLNYNGGSGPNLGIKNIDNSFAIVFDMCPEFPDCSKTSQQLRVHFKATGDRKNSVSTSTRSTYDAKVYQNWKDSKVHSVEVLYYEQPDWLEVYVDNSLRLVERGFSMQRIIGGRDAFVGFSSSSSNQGKSMQTEIKNVIVKTIKVVPSNTISLENPTLFPKTFVANGRDHVEFSFQTKDACLNLIQFGGLTSLVHGRLVASSISDLPPSIGRRRLLNESESLILIGEAVDNADGSYKLKFKTDVLANFTAHLAFGSGCSWNGTAFSTSANCKPFVYSNAALSTPFNTIAPTSFETPTGLDSSSLVGIGIAVGIISACGGVMLFVGIRIRNQWRRDKRFVDAGKVAVAEREMKYIGDSDLDSLQNKLQATQHAIQAERAKKIRQEDKQEVIDELHRQKGELQEMVRRLKIKQSGGDPNLPDPNDNFGVLTRVRKSFAASRMSRGPSLFDHQTGEASAGNPLFTRLRKSISRQKHGETVSPILDV